MWQKNQIQHAYDVDYLHNTYQTDKNISNKAVSSNHPIMNIAETILGTNEEQLERRTQHFVKVLNSDPSIHQTADRDTIPNNHQRPKY